MEEKIEKKLDFDAIEAIAAENILATVSKRQLVELRKKMREASKSTIIDYNKLLGE